MELMNGGRLMTRVEFNMRKMERATTRTLAVFDVDHSVIIGFSDKELASINLSCETLCTNDSHGKRVSQLTEMFFNALKEGLESKVIPSLQGKDNPHMLLEELSNMWEKFKKMETLLSSIFAPLDRLCFNIAEQSLKAFAYDYFCALVMVSESMHHGKFADATIHIFKQGRGENQLNPELSDLLKKALLAEYTSYYPNLSSEWVANDSVDTYFSKVLQSELLEKKLGAYFSCWADIDWTNISY